MPNYYGPNEIVSATKDFEKMKMVYRSGETEVVSEELYKAGITKEESDLTSLRERRLKPVIQEVMAILLKYDIKPNNPMNEVDGLLMGIKTSFEDSYQKATEFRWGIKEKDLKFSDIDKALKDD